MRKVVIVLSAGAMILLCLGFAILYAIGNLVRLPDVPQPEFGFTGQWRRYSQFGWKEAPLPPASEVWKHYESWKSETNNLSARFYVVRMGFTERQLNFRSATNMTSGMPLGDYHYTTVEFDYRDPTNGLYHLTWRLRGEHDTSFLRFDKTERLYQLELNNLPNEFPPSLSIEAIEGIKPWEQ